MYGVLMTLKKWNGLPADVQKMLLAAGKDTQEWHRKEVLKMVTEAIADLKKNGMDIYTLPKEEWEVWRKATLKSAEDLLITKTGDEGRKLIQLAEAAR